MWAPQVGPQLDAISADWCPELLYGGAAGGGKSDFLLGDFLQDVKTYEAAWRGVLFRRTYPELEELIARSLEMYPSTGAVWSDSKKLWTWPNGAVLRMRYLERDLDALRYQGHQYTWIGWDELTQWPSLYAYRYLKSRLRSAHPVPTKRIRAACNPGGPGHAEVKDYYVDPAPGGFAPIVDPETGQERMFIPAKLKDNKILLAHDPDYEQRLKGLGSAELVRCLLEGDWNVVEGAFFDGWSSARHVVKPFEIPAHWMRFRSMDWGYAAPSSVGWWAVVSDDYRVSDDLVLPRGCLVRYRELYTAAKPNVGRRLTAEELAGEIGAMTPPTETISYTVADPAIFAQNGGPSVSERLAMKRIHCTPADNTRVGKSGHMGGWDQMRARLRGEDHDRPMMVVFSTCRDFIRTVPVLQHDRTRAEDIDTSAEDHVADEARYACMSRPYVKDPTPERKRRDPYADDGRKTSAWAA